jgi:hypothetical protein
MNLKYNTKHKTPFYKLQVNEACCTCKQKSSNLSRLSHVMHKAS